MCVCFGAFFYRRKTCIDDTAATTSHGIDVQIATDHAYCHPCDKTVCQEKISQLTGVTQHSTTQHSYMENFCDHGILTS